MTIRWLMTTKKSPFFEFTVILVIAILVRGNGIFGLGWSCDDLLSIADPTGVGYAASQASQLRLFAALTTRLVGWLGVAFPPLGSFWNVAHLASMTLFALGLRRLWIPGSASVYAILIGLLFTLFPYHINLLSFQLQHPSMVLSYLSGAYALFHANRPGWRRWLSVLAIAISLSYQTMISYFIAAGLVLVLITLVRRDSAATEAAETRDLQPVWSYAGLIGLGVIAYFALSLFSLPLAGVGMSDRATFAGVDQWPQKLQLILNHLKRTAYGQEPSMARSSKLMQSSLWLIVLGGLVAQSRPAAFRRRPLLLPLLAVVPLAIVASAFLPTILMSHTSENPRNLLATVVFAAGGLALSSLLRFRALRLAAAALASGMVLSYAVVTNALSVDQARLTSRDVQQATRMVERLEQARGNQPLRSVVFVGAYSPAEGLRGREYFQSAFQVRWAQVPMLQEATGQVFQEPVEADRARMLRLAENRPAWPAKDSVAVDGDVGLIVLSNP